MVFLTFYDNEEEENKFLLLFTSADDVIAVCLYSTLKWNDGSFSEPQTSGFMRILDDTFLMLLPPIHVWLCGWIIIHVYDEKLNFMSYKSVTGGNRISPFIHIIM